MKEETQKKKKSTTSTAKTSAKKKIVKASPKKQTSKTKKATPKTKEVANENVTVKEEVVEVVEVKEEKVEKKAEKKKESKPKKNVSSDNEFIKLIKIILIVAAIFVAFYGITYLITNNDKKKESEEETPEVSIQYTEILMSNLLKQNNDKYYVLAYHNGDKYYDTYANYINSYSSKKDSLSFYEINLSNAFNSKYFDKDAEKSTIKESKVDGMVLNRTTLFKIEKGKVVKTYEGYKKVMEQLKKL